jgi:ribosomal protein S27E
MKISDVTCPQCEASYLVAESVSANGSPGDEICTICGTTLANWSDGKLRAFRLMMSPARKYPRVPAPPAAVS